MIERGILPEGTQLTPMNPMSADTANPDDAVRPWDALSDDEKRLFSRMAEVYAAFSEYTDHQVGRIIDYLEQTGQLDNTLIFYAADNGASGEGSPNGIGQREHVLQRLAVLDRRQPGDDRSARIARDLQPLSDRVGDGVLDAVPDVQALHATRAACAIRW